MDPLETNLDHVLQGGYFHPLLRNWQETNTSVLPETLVYPVFVTDNPEAEEEIPSLPGKGHIELVNLALKIKVYFLYEMIKS